MDDLELANKVAWSMIGKPYVWGGDDPMAGFDCSGVIVEILQSIGYLGRYDDLSAHGFFNKYHEMGRVWHPGEPDYRDGKSYSDVPPSTGCLVFWHANNEPGRVIHVEYCIDKTRSIGASGGGSKTKTIEDAITQNACVKIRPFATRKNLLAFADVFRNSGAFNGR